MLGFAKRDMLGSAERDMSHFVRRDMLGFAKRDMSSLPLGREKLLFSRSAMGEFWGKEYWGKFLAPALFLAPKSKGAVVGASPTTPKNGSGSAKGGFARAPSVIFLRKCHLPLGGRLLESLALERADG